jgi:hypothetical protein
MSERFVVSGLLTRVEQTCLCRPDLLHQLAALRRMLSVLKLRKMMQHAFGGGSDHLRIGLVLANPQQPVMTYRSLIARDIQPGLVRIEVTHQLYSPAARPLCGFADNILSSGLVGTASRRCALAILTPRCLTIVLETFIMIGAEQYPAYRTYRSHVGMFPPGG